MSTFRRIDSLLDGKTSDQLASDVAARAGDRGHLRARPRALGDRLVWGARRLKMVAGDLGESAMQALSELVGRILVLRTKLSGDHDPGGGDPGETG